MTWDENPAYVLRYLMIEAGLPVNEDYIEELARLCGTGIEIDGELPTMSNEKYWTMPPALAAEVEELRMNNYRQAFAIALLMDALHEAKNASYYEHAFLIEAPEGSDDITVVLGKEFIDQYKMRVEGGRTAMEIRIALDEDRNECRIEIKYPEVTQ